MQQNRQDWREQRPNALVISSDSESDDDEHPVRPSNITQQSTASAAVPAPLSRPEKDKRAPSLFISHPRPRPLGEDRQRANAQAGSSFASSSSSASWTARPAPTQPVMIKQRMFDSIKANNTAAGIPIAVPADNWHQRGLVGSSRPAPVSQIDNGIETDVLEALGKLSVKDNLTKNEQEEALMELFNSTLDMNGVDVSADIPRDLRCQLMPHQVQGLFWLKDREKGKKRGGILADDMGLGKTIQMIALILAERPSTGDKTTLIICPVSLMHQWKTEIETKTSGTLRVLVHHGASRRKAGKELARYDVVITSYQTAASEWPGKVKGGDDRTSDSEAQASTARGALFDNVSFHRIILDEAHAIKGRNTNANKACRALKGQYRWCLTGTPIQNTVMDLFSLFEFLGPVVKPLHEVGEFKAKIETPLKNRRAKLAMARLQVVLKAVMLRRTKTMQVDGKAILTLPPRTIVTVAGPFLDEDEKLFYEAVEKKMTLAMNAFIKAGTAMSNYTSVLILLLTAAKIDDAASSATPSADQVSNGDVLDTKVALDKGVVETVKVSDTLRPSTKIKKCLSILKNIRQEKKKTIIFSQFVKMFEVLEPFLKSEGYRCVRYDGSMNPVERERALTAIRNDPEVTVILISIKAGSVGLNLTCCSRVILLDLWWNPQIEQQAFDRAHRVGQKDEVKIYKITIDGTVEDRILQLQSQKAEIAQAALEGGNVSANKLTMKDILFLFRSDAANHGGE